MTVIKSTNGKYAVEIVATGEKLMACAVFCDGMSYDGSNYWFTIGHYKTMKSAIAQSIKKMSRHNIELEIL